MVAYLKDHTILGNEKIWKLVQEEKDHFKIGKYMTTDKLLLYWKIRDDEISEFEPEYWSNVVERIHTEYGYQGFPSLLGIIKPWA